jgi:hypothetical protein
MAKNSILLLFSVLAGFLLVVLGYLWFSPQNSELIKPFFPTTKFSLENAPTQSLVGNIATISGNVVWLSRTATFATPINSPIKIQQGEEVDTKANGNIIIEFLNHAAISIMPNTQINFIQTLPANIVLEQKKGKAIYKENPTGVPLSVVDSNILIDIKGIVVIANDSKTPDITVSVEEGSAKVAYVDLENNSNVLNLKSGQKYVFNDNKKEGIIE